MAVTAFGTNDAQTVKIWSSLTLREALKATLTDKIMGTGKTAIIGRLTELEKSAGDQIKYDLLMQMTGSGVTGDNRMRDNEEALVYYQETVEIDQLLSLRRLLLSRHDRSSLVLRTQVHVLLFSKGLTTLNIH